MSQVQQILAGQPLLLQLAGLDHMSDDPTDINVLYLQVGAAVYYVHVLSYGTRQAQANWPSAPHTIGAGKLVTYAKDQLSLLSAF